MTRARPTQEMGTRARRVLNIGPLGSQAETHSGLVYSESRRHSCG
jgi:hypothetical protein